jgi:hypothetical protein
MAKLIQFDFSYNGPYGDEMATALRGLAESIVKEPGFIWKIWTENSATKEAGGIYLFEDEKSAESYIRMHTERLQQFGIGEVRTKMFDVNRDLTAVTKGPMS